MSAANRIPSIGRWLSALLRMGRAARIQTQRQWSRLKHTEGRKSVVWLCATAAGVTTISLMLYWQFVSIADVSTVETTTTTSMAAETSPAKLQSRGISSRRVATAKGKKRPLTSDAKSGPRPTPSADRIQEPPFDAPPPTDLEQSAEKNRADEDGALTLEFKRFRISHTDASDDGFLVTSLVSPKSPVVQPGGVDRRRKKNEPGPSRVKQRIHSDDGWSAVPGKPGVKSIVRVRHGLRAKPVPSLSEVSVSSTASATWFVTSPELRCRLICEERVAMGSPFRILLRVTNTGTATATGVKLHVDLPDSLSYRRGRRLVHEIGRLEPGATHVARLTPRAVNSGRFQIFMSAICDIGLEAESVRQIVILPAGSAIRRTNAAPAGQGASLR